MVRSKEGIERNKARRKFLKQEDKHPTHHRFAAIPKVIPESHCQCCKSKGRDSSSENFDENGYPIQRSIAQAGKAAEQLVRHAPPGPTSTETKHFRLLDLPPEIRNRIYELVVSRPEKVICLSDRLLRPSDDLYDVRDVLRECSSQVICLPCQLHGILGTGHLGLSRANKQLHSEMSLIPYGVHTFGVHNLYYLQTFLCLIGQKGRQSLKSLRFIWTLPEEEAVSLDMQTSLEETYMLLGECKSLISLSASLDLDNMLRRYENGKERSVPSSYIYEIPHTALIYGLRGLKDVSIGWKLYDGLHGMEEWAKGLAGYWRLPRGTDGSIAVAVDAEVKVSDDQAWCSIEWKAGAEAISDA